MCWQICMGYGRKDLYLNLSYARWQFMIQWNFHICVCLCCMYFQLKVWVLEGKLGVGRERETKGEKEKRKMNREEMRKEGRERVGGRGHGALCKLFEQCCLLVSVWCEWGDEDAQWASALWTATACSRHCNRCASGLNVASFSDVMVPQHQPAASLGVQTYWRKTWLCWICWDTIHWFCWFLCAFKRMF